MSSLASSISQPYQLKLKAPQQHGETLVAPIDTAQAELKPSELFTESALQGLRTDARKELLEIARQYTHQLMPESLRLEESAADKPLIVTGHQPELFHPGVWFKNFLAGEVAKRQNGMAINLVIDSDRIKHPAVLLPGNVNQHFDKQVIAYDGSHFGSAWESASVQQRSRFDAFPNRVIEALRPHCSHQPLVKRLWEVIQQTSMRNGCLSLSCLFTAGRMQLERRAGLANLELPMSRLTESKSFLRFLGSLLADARRFATNYNQSLNDYRLKHQLSSPERPVPNLEITAETIEMPFWSVQTQTGVRESLVLKSGHILTDTANRFHLPLEPGASIEAFLSSMENLYQSQAIRIRTKALTTTLFTRLFFADLFVHGIGGSLYDEVTDELIVAHYGCSAPAFLAATGTWHLPFSQELPELRGEEIPWGEQKHQMRWNPERIEDGLSHTAEMQSAINHKQQLIESHQGMLKQYGTHSAIPLSIRREEYQQFSESRSQLLELTETRRLELHHQHEKAEQQERLLKMQRSREYSYCLFPETLPGQLADAASEALSR